MLGANRQRAEREHASTSCLFALSTLSRSRTSSTFSGDDKTCRDTASRRREAALRRLRVAANGRLPARMTPELSSSAFWLEQRWAVCGRDPGDGRCIRNKIRPNFMALDSLGYFGVRTRNLDDWSSFGEKFLGLQLVDRSAQDADVPHGRSPPAHRRPRRRRQRAESGRRSWAGKSAAAPRSTSLAATLEAARSTCSGRRERRPKSGASKTSSAFDDPIGNRLEAFHGAGSRDRSVHAWSRDFRIPNGSARHGPRRAQRRAASTTCCRSTRDVLGFHLSDFTLRPFKAYFLHLNPAPSQLRDGRNRARTASIT